MDQRYLSVTALNRYLKAKMDSDPHLSRLFIQGELSNVKYHYSGHCYFTLKDEKSRISAVMFSAQVKKVPFLLEDGMKVLASARLSVYEPQGNYQLYVDKIEMDGLGNLFMAYEKLRLKLEKEGLFAIEHKKELPTYPEKIGIITASTGAAIHDITKTIHQNCPSAKMYFYPSLVQGEQAAQNLCMRLMQADNDGLDVIIIGRGGGSLEDLWAFNDEKLARLIYQAKTPIISGVGHESDVTICDFAADRRAATPTAAAHLAVFNQSDFENYLKETQAKMFRLCMHHLEIRQKDLQHIRQSNVFKHPQVLYENAMMHLDELSSKLISNMHFSKKQADAHLNTLELCLKNRINMMIAQENQQLKQYQLLISKEIIHQLEIEKQRFEHNITQLNALSPLNVLLRGYTLSLQEDKVISRLAQLNQKKPLTLRFSDGDVTVAVKENEDEKNEL